MQDMRIAIPAKGMGKEKTLSALKDFSGEDPDYKTMKMWSLVYYLGEEHADFLTKAYGMFLSANGLNPMAFKSLKKMETQVVNMTASLLNGPPTTTGVMTSGGTESCLLAVKTYRDRGRAERKTKKPEMILPETAHVAWEKGAEYFGVRIRRASLSANFAVDVQSVKRLISRNTVMILGSAPEYPHGMIDPIEGLGAIALKENIPLHVDACLGGFLLPFIEKLGYPLPVWDFRVPGVASISADVHKYGFSAKGSSVILYRDIELMKHQFFISESWPGGAFASPALLGTRPGGAYAAAWASLMAIGEDGFKKNAGDIMEAAKKIRDGIRAIGELEVIGEPPSAIFAYKSNSKEVNIYAVADQMEKRGWHIDRLQKPEALHVMVTPRHLEIADSYLDDLQESVAFVKKHPELGFEGGAAMYGMIANIPLRKIVKKNILKMFCDLYGPEGRMINPVDFKADEAGTEADIPTRAALLYLKLRKKLTK
jgi:glutamate/tyrosine decarboxylase-like PLP-dependent enzyme